jgi:hypothetical protein
VDYEKCVRLLNKLSLSASYPRELDEDDLEFYTESLREFGWDRVYEALHRLRQSVMRLPSVAEIKSAMGIAAPLGAEQQIEMQAKLLGTTIESCFGTFGYTDPAGARERIGEVGWAALGGTRGWIELCQLPSYDDLPIRLAQIREAAKALMLLPPEKRQGQFAPPERPAIDHTAARLAAAQKQLAEAKALLGIFTEAESDKQTGKLISFNRASERE